MSDNKFEKQVQQKLDELKLPPSPGVWQGIEEALRGKKRRDFPLWLAAGLLLVAGGTYFWYASVNDRPVSISGKEKIIFNKNTDKVEAGKENNTIKEEGKSFEKKEKSSVPKEKNPALQQQFGKNEKLPLTSGKSREAVGATSEKKKGIVQEEKLPEHPQIISPEVNFPAKEKTGYVQGNNLNRKVNLLTANQTASSIREKNYAGADLPTAEKEIFFSLPSTRLKGNEYVLPAREIASSTKEKTSPPGKLSVTDQGLPSLKENFSTDEKPVFAAGHNPTVAVPASLPDNNDEASTQLHEVSPAYGHIPGESRADSADIQMLSALSLPTNAAKKDDAAILTRAPQSAMNKTSAGKNKRPGKDWEYGITGGIGMSYINDGNGLSFTKAMVEDVSMASNTTTNSLLIPGPTLALYAASTIKPALSYSLGVAVKKALSKRIALSAGLSYVQYNARTEVGNKVDASQVVNNGPTGYLRVETYYLNAQAHDYNNRYHFIYLPVGAHLKLNNGEKFPVYLNAGMAVSRLISSNSLHFDGTTGVYYRNNDLINKTQADISSGISVVLFNRHSTPLWVGPAFRYNLSSLLQKDVSGTKRLIYAGLDLKMFLKK